MPRRDIETWMWERANDLLDQVDKLQRQFFHPGHVSHLPSWQPPADVFETSDAVWVIVALPGVDPERVELVIDERGLVLRGTRSLSTSLPEGCQHAVVHRLELPHGVFERSIALPPGTYKGAEKQAVNGCIVVSLKKGT